MNAVRASNSPAIPPDKVLGFRTRREADEYMMDHPDGCLGAVHFVRQQGASGAFSYIVTSNSTVRGGAVCQHEGCACVWRGLGY